MRRVKSEKLLEKIEILRDVQMAQRQFAAGQGVPHDEARAQILAQLAP